MGQVNKWAELYSPLITSCEILGPSQFHGPSVVILGYPYSIICTRLIELNPTQIFIVVPNLFGIKYQKEGMELTWRQNLKSTYNFIIHNRKYVI